MDRIKLVNRSGFYNVTSGVAVIMDGAQAPIEQLIRLAHERGIQCDMHTPLAWLIDRLGCEDLREEASSGQDEPNHS